MPQLFDIGDAYAAGSSKMVSESMHMKGACL